MSVDEIDTILLIKNVALTWSLAHSWQKPILQQNYTQMDRDKQEKEILNFVKS